MAARGLSNLANATEAALIAASQAKDQAAFGELVKRRQGWARALLRRMCNNYAEADDLAQEAFIKAGKGSGIWRPPRRFQAGSGGSR